MRSHVTSEKIIQNAPIHATLQFPEASKVKIEL